MGKIAFVFSGQGSQYPGMGREICDMSPAAAEVFRMADKIRPGTSQMCFNGTKEELAQTENTQPCLFTVSLACASALTEAGLKAQGCAGFSLGEMSALAFSGVLDFEDSFNLVCRRAAIMQEWAEKSNGAMAAVVRLSVDEVLNLCSMFTRIYPACFNFAQQTVVSGDKQQLEEFIKVVEEKKGRAIMLDVNGAFHSPLMASASHELSIVLEDYEFEKPRYPLFANATAEEFFGNAKELVAKQISNPVRWQKTIENMVSRGFDIFVEVGAKKTLSSFIEKITCDVVTLHVEDIDGFNNTMSTLLVKQKSGVKYAGK